MNTKRRSIFRDSFVFIYLLGILACNKPQEGDRLDYSTSAGAGTRERQPVTVSIAPFDRFPATDAFPLVFRFSRAVAPSDRAAAENFSLLTISPQRFGSWRWESDSELQFVPQDGWSPRERVKVSLKGLKTSDGTVADSKERPIQFSPEEFDAELPAPLVSVSECSLRIKNKAPLVQYPFVELRLNYKAEFKDILSLTQLDYTQAGRSEKLSLVASTGVAGMRIGLTGPDLFRPEGATQLSFRLQPGLPFVRGGAHSGVTLCGIATDPAVWDSLAEQIKLSVSEKPLVTLYLTAPAGVIGERPRDYRKPLRVQFQRADNGTSVAHGKAKGLTLERGLTLSPEISGVWKTSEDDESVLLFNPKSDWPVGTRLKLAIDADTFPEVRLKAAEAEFVTPRLEARFTNTGFYTDPENPLSRQVVATLELSHLPKAGEVERLVTARFRTEPEKDIYGKMSEMLSFTAAADEKEPWKFYLKSELFSLPEEPGEAAYFLAAGLVPLSEGVSSEVSISSRIGIPSRRDIYRISSATSSVVRNNNDRFQRVLTVEVTEPTAVAKLHGALELYLLPDCQLKENRKLCRDRDQFGDEGAVLPEVLSQSEIVPLAVVPGDDQTLPNFFHFSYEAPGKREVFFRVKKGLTSETSFLLASDFRTIMFTAPFPRELKIMHEGSLLSLSGSRNLGVSLRGVQKVEYELARILAGDVHHFVSINSGTFQQPFTWGGGITLDQLTERFRYVENFPDQDPSKIYYSAVDFGRFMAQGQSPKGLFLLTVREKKEEAEQTRERGESVPEVSEQRGCFEGNECDEGDENEEEGSSEECGEGECDEAQDRSVIVPQSRLVLLTDLGLVVKDSLSGNHDLFVMSFKAGGPVSGATVRLLGQNGVALFSAVSDADGRVSFPPTADLKQEKVPLIYLAEKGEDYSFLPFERSDRELNFSRFETGGVVNQEEAEGLRALVFTDRGIYRPGEEARFGVVVRRRNLGIAGAKIPLEMSLTDPRGIEILSKKFVTSELGFDDFRWSSENSPTGSYTFSVYLVRDEKKGTEKKGARALLGSSLFRVDEFQPDKLNVRARYIEGGVPEGVVPNAGWASPKGAFEVSVQNLFGTAAVENTVKGTLLARPWDGALPGFERFAFYTAKLESTLPDQPEDLGEQATDTGGIVRFQPDLGRFAERAYRVEFASEVFEKDSGRSVVCSTSALVSAAEHFLGWKADGSLGYIDKGSKRRVDLLAVNSALKRVALHDLRARLEETRMISALIKQPNGMLRYQLTPKVSVVWSGPLSISEGGTPFDLKTDEPGDFKLRIFEGSVEKEAEAIELASIHYIVHGEGNTTFLADRNAEVGIQLKSSSVEKGQELEVSINTPYVGTGLLTIERDKVYAAKWFKMDTLSSVQRIKVPDGVVGNAYVAVAFVRSVESKDIFAAPLSYGVKPFSIAKSTYTTKIDLFAPGRVVPGNNLEVQYKLSAPGKFLIYAVDEGILQFARYKTPDLVSHFVPKRALEVRTFQILDLLLPDYKIVSELSSTGGDEDIGLGKFRNPFARKRRAPMAFWSGVIGENAAAGTVAVPIPEYFNGTVRIVAVQVGERTLGVQTTKSVAQHDFVIEPQVPYFVSPGDEFEIGATVANTVVGSGGNAKLKVQVVPSSGLELADPSPIELVVPESEDRSFRVKVRAKEALGEQSVRVRATGLNREGSAVETISLRPPQVFRTTLQTGVYRPAEDGASAKQTLAVQRDMFSEKREVTASVSLSPVSVGRGLVKYLKDYPYGCTEQLVSTAFPSVLFGADPELGLSHEEVSRYTKRAFQALSSRQRADGSFGVWDITSAADVLFSVYATHFLIEARDRGFEVPEIVFDRAQKWLVNLGSQTTYEANSQLSQAYALYLRARLGEQVTKDAERLVGELDRQWGQRWKGSGISLFLSGAFQLLQMDKEAKMLLVRPPQIWSSTFPWPLSDSGLYGSLYSWISARHFPKDTWLSPLDTATPVLSMIEEGAVTSFSSSFAVMGLRAMAEELAPGQRDLLRILGSPGPKPFELSGERILRAEIPSEVKDVIYQGKEGQMFFYELGEAGFDRRASKPFSSGLTIDRELKNEKGELQSEYSLHDKLEVTVRIKANENLSRMAIVELLPGGFEVDLSDDGLGKRQSLRPGPNSWKPDFIDIQEDRIIFFGDIPQDTVTFTYRLKPLCRGSFTFAAPYAEGMYDPRKGFLGSAASLKVN